GTGGKEQEREDQQRPAHRWTPGTSAKALLKVLRKLAIAPVSLRVARRGEKRSCVTSGTVSGLGRSPTLIDSNAERSCMSSKRLTATLAVMLFGAVSLAHAQHSAG